MNAKALEDLGLNARAWARCYVAIKDALIKEGVQEEEAQDQAARAANVAGMWEPDEEDGGPPWPI